MLMVISPGRLLSRPGLRFSSVTRLNELPWSRLFRVAMIAWPSGAIPGEATKRSLATEQPKPGSKRQSGVALLVQRVRTVDDLQPLLAGRPHRRARSLILDPDHHQEGELIRDKLIDWPGAKQMFRQVVRRAEACEVAKQTRDDEGELFPIVGKGRHVEAEVTPINMAVGKKLLDSFATGRRGLRDHFAEVLPIPARK